MCHQDESEYMRGRIFSPVGLVETVDGTQRPSRVFQNPKGNDLEQEFHFWQSSKNQIVIDITSQFTSLWARMMFRASAGSWSTALLLKSPALWERMKAEQIDPSMVEGRTSASNHTRIALHNAEVEKRG